VPSLETLLKAYDTVMEKPCARRARAHGTAEDLKREIGFHTGKPTKRNEHSHDPAFQEGRTGDALLPRLHLKEVKNWFKPLVL
jgi:hypothetical protein